MKRMMQLFSVLQEEEEGGYDRRIGGTVSAREARHEERVREAPSPMDVELIRGLIVELAEQRKTILDNDKYTAKEKLALLDDNRKAIAVASGRTVRRTENVVYGLLTFGAVGLIVLALLTTFAGLPHEVTLSFVGTVLGGTIATIAQKLGNL